MEKDKLQKYFMDVVKEFNNKHSFLNKEQNIIFTEEEKEYIKRERASFHDALKTTLGNPEDYRLHPLLADSLERLTIATGLGLLGSDLEAKGKHEEALLEYIKSILISGNEVYDNYFFMADIFYKIGKEDKSLIFYQLYLQEAEKHKEELKQRANQKDADIIDFISRKCGEARQRIKELTK